MLMEFLKLGSNRLVVLLTPFLNVNIAKIKLILKANILRGHLFGRSAWVNVLSGPSLSLFLQVQVGR